jgi:MtrB/PioB family decaheme-associated outer membrane protein
MAMEIIATRNVSVRAMALVAALLAGLPMVLLAQDDAARVSTGTLELGIGFLDEGSYRFGRFSGLAERGLEPIVTFSLSSQPAWDRAERHWFSVEAVEPGGSARRLAAEAGRRGSDRVRLSFIDMPRYRSADGRTPFRAANSGLLTLPAAWQAEGNTTSGLGLLDASLRPVQIRERRRRLAIDYRRTLPEDWQLRAAWRHDLQGGTRILGGEFGTTGGNSRAALLPVALDQRTDVFDLAIERHAGRAGFVANYSGSMFSNNAAPASWQNPYGAHPQWAAGVGYPEGIGRLGQAPDNSFHQIGLSTAYRLGDATTLRASASHGRMRQNDPLLAYTINPQLVIDAPLPRERLDARLDTTVVNLAVSTRPMRGSQLTLQYHVDERNNRTPRESWRIIRGDAENQRSESAARLNRPYGLRTQRVTGRFSHRLTRELRLLAGYEYRQQERDYSEVRRVDEHSASLGLRYRVALATLGVDMARERRDAGDYVGNRPLLDTRIPGTVGADDFDNHPLLRKYYLADRDRDRVQVRIDVPAGDAFHLGAAFAFSRDDYRNSVFGLTGSSMRSLMLDGGWTPNEDWRVHVFMGRDRYATAQAGRSFTSAPATVTDPGRDWRVDTRDRFNTLGLTVELTDPARSRLAPGGRPIDLGVEFVHVRSRGGIDVEAGAALASDPVPDLYSRLNHLRAYAGLRVDDRSGLRLAWTHERYASRDFALDATDPATIANVIALGERSPRYAVNWVTLGFTRSF